NSKSSPLSSDPSLLFFATRRRGSILSGERCPRTDQITKCSAFRDSVNTERSSPHAHKGLPPSKRAPLITEQPAGHGPRVLPEGTTYPKHSHECESLRAASDLASPTVLTQGASAQ